tara:strand:+ start:1562 stop:1744 length:183 start_codon:yes stop_codon:yes gene_type:complete
MLTTDIVIALSRWIKDWKITYGEYPTLDECITWVEWKFKVSSVTQGEKERISEILSFNNF